MKINKVYGKVQNNKFIPNSLELFIGAFKDFEGKNIELSIRQNSDSRTNPQNAYYWGVVLKLISESTGYTDDELHVIFKQKYLIDNERLLDVARKKIIDSNIPYLSTTQLNSVEFNEFLEKIKNFASLELGIYIPDPNEQIETKEFNKF